MADQATRLAEYVATFRAARERWGAAMRSLPDAAFVEPSVPGWTFGDLVGHMAWWNDRFCGVIELQLAGRDPLLVPGESMDEKNEWVRAQIGRRPAAALRAWDDLAADRIVDVVGRLTPEQVFEPGRIPWYQGAPLADEIESYRLHFHEHADEVERRARLGQGPA